MTDKEKIKTEIKRQITELTTTKEKIGIVGGVAVKRHLESIISFIDSLQEGPVSEDLDYIEEELNRLIRIHKPNEDFGWGTLYNVATHFFELGLKAQKGE